MRAMFAVGFAAVTALVVVVPWLLNAAVSTFALLLVTAVVGFVTFAISWATFAGERRFLRRPQNRVVMEGGAPTVVLMAILEWPGRLPAWRDGEVSFGDLVFVLFGIVVFWSVMVVAAGFLYLFSLWYVRGGEPLEETRRNTLTRL